MKRVGWVLLACVALGAGVAQAIHLKVSLSELSQTADLIFIGTVTGQSTRLSATRTMPLTDVVFAEIQVVHATPQSVQRDAATITLTYAGGAFGNAFLAVSDTPEFVAGRRYLVFASDDGRSYFTPVVGGPQGQFEVVADQATGRSYLLTTGRRAVTAIEKDDIVASASRVTRIENGVLVADRAVPSQAREAGAPLAERPGDSFRTHEVSRPSSPMLLSAFLDYVRNVALPARIDLSRIKRDGVGQFYHVKDGRVVAEPLPRATLPTRRPLLDVAAPRQPGSPAAAAGEPDRSVEPLGADLFWCGQQGPPVVMEQVLGTMWEWQVNNESMVWWNRVMDVFRYSWADGRYGHNDESEFIGYPTSADLIRVYGATAWGPTIVAKTLSWTDWCECCEIEESDIAWNPAYSWTNDFSLSLGNPLLVLQAPVTIHELGHTIGLQRGDETYDYDRLSVMHAYYDDIVEDGKGVHGNDAALMRLNYGADLPSLNFADMGVESYYADNGLHTATTSDRPDGRPATTFVPGQFIMISGITVENISNAAQNNVRIRLYLSDDTTITTADRQMGGYGQWDSFCGECYNVGSYTTAIPEDTPPGTWYVGAIVTRDGFRGDDNATNNQTFLPTPITVSCNALYDVVPSSMSLPRTGGTASVTVDAPGTACPWTASVDVPWITITSGASGTGNESIAYRVAANTGASRSGHVSVRGTLHVVFQEAGCLASGDNPISVWGNVSGTLSTTDCLSADRVISDDLRPYADRFTFTGTAGQQVAILATSTGVDVYLTLYGPTGSLLAYDDNGGGGPNARIPSGAGYWTLTSAGTYAIEVTSTQISTGAYLLKLLAPMTLVVTPASGVVTGCLPAKARIGLWAPAPAGGLFVSISDTLSAASPPTLVRVPQFTTAVTFTVPTAPVASNQIGVVEANVGGPYGVTGSDNLIIRPMSVRTLSLAPNPVVGPNGVTGTVTLECLAGPGPVAVTLSTSAASVAWPVRPSMLIPAGTKTGTFPVATADVLVVRLATIRATANGRSRSQKLTVQ